MEKADPFAFRSETPPKNASMIWPLNYKWGDGAWMRKRARHNALDRPMSIYEVHPGSWMRVPEEGNRWLTYRELAVKLADYCLRDGLHARRVAADHGASVLRFVGLPDDRLLRADSRYGTPQDFMYWWITCTSRASA